MRTGASSVRYTAFRSNARSENAPSPKHIYCIEINQIAYLECLVIVSTMHSKHIKHSFVNKKKKPPQFIEVHRENCCLLRTAYCTNKDTPLWNYSLSLAFVFHLCRFCNISALRCQLLIVSNMQSTNVKQLFSSAGKYTIHRSTSLNHILRSQTLRKCPLPHTCILLL